MSISKRYTLGHINEIMNARFYDNNVQYLLDLKSQSRGSWIPHTNIASQTKQSPKFNDWIKKCPKIPPRFKNHKDLIIHSTKIQKESIAICLEVYVNREVSSMIMFPFQYNLCYFAGIQVLFIVKSILRKYKEKFHYLPIRPNGIFRNTGEVCFVAFKYILNCIQKTYI